MNIIYRGIKVLMDEPNDNWLPEELKNRLLYTSRLTSWKQKIEDAGTNPFTKEEILWLDNKYGYLSEPVFFLKDRNILAISAHNSRRVWDEPPEDILEYLTISYKDNICTFDNMTTRVNNVNLYLPYLTGRLDYDIKQETDVKIGTYDPSMADTVLPSVRYIFLIIKRRFSRISSEKSAELARFYTIKALNTVVDALAPKRTLGIVSENDGHLSLLLYLLLNLNIFEHVKISSYFFQGDIELTNEYLDGIENQCTLFYELLLSYINELE